MSNFSLIDAFTGIAARKADCEAVATHEVSHRYSDIMRIASQCARRFVAYGVVPGDRIAIALSKADEVIVAMLASWMIGATCVVIDFRSKRPEKALLAKSFNLRAIVESHAPASRQDYVSITTGHSLVEAVAAERGEAYVRPAQIHPAIIVRTSGTTGTPVGVLYNHDTLMRLHWTMSQCCLGFDRGLFVHAMPLFYGAAIFRTMSQLLDGGPLHMLPAFSSAGEITEKLLSSKARQVMVVPPQLRGLLELSKGRSAPMFPDLDALHAGGAQISGETTVRAYRELSNNFRISYGASISSHIAMLAGEDVLRRPESVGRPLVFTHLRITDFDGTPLPPGEAGLVCIRSPTVADDVIGDARAQSDRLIDGWAVPGDIGFLDHEGFLTLTGRASDLIIRKGVNVYPREIENVLEQHDDVVEAAAVGYRHEEVGEEIAAFVVVRSSITVEALHSYVQANIVADKRPRVIHILDEFPRNDAGKLLKRVLVETLVEQEG